MIKLLLFFSFIFSFTSLASHHTPDEVDANGNFNFDAGTSYLGTVRFFQKEKKFNHQFQFAGSSKVDHRKYKEITLGTRYRLHRNLKVGIFASEKWGLIHDEDWTDFGNTWDWKDTNSRAEFELTADLIPRYLLDFLPGENWVGEVRIRFKRNFHASENTIIARPGLTYFYFHKGKPFLNFFFQYEWHRALNYGFDKDRERWLYLGAMYHVDEVLKIGLSYSDYQMIWEGTEEFTRLEGDNFKEIEKGHQVGLFVNFMNIF